MNDLKDLEIMQLLEQQDQTITELKTQAEEKDQMIQKLLSDKLKLSKKVQEQTGQIVKLNGSDLQLKKAVEKEKRSEMLLQEAESIKAQAEADVKAARADRDSKIEAANGKLEKIRADADRQIENIRNQCRKDNEAAARARSDGEQFRDEQRRLRNDERSLIEQKAEEKISKRASEMEKREYDFNQKTNNYYKGLFTMKESWYKGIFSFCILFLVIEALTSGYFRDCCIRCASWIFDIERHGWDAMRSGAETASGIAERIENPTVAAIVGGILLVIVGIILFAFFCAGIPVLITALTILYVRSRFFDKPAKWIMVGSGIFAVSLASEPIDIMAGQNIILWWIIVQIAVPLIRFAVYPLLTAVLTALSNAVRGVATYSNEELRRRLVGVLIVVGSVIFGGVYLFVIMPKLYG